MLLKLKDLDVFIMLISTVCHNRDAINGDFLSKNKLHWILKLNDSEISQ